MSGRTFSENFFALNVKVIETFCALNVGRFTLMNKTLSTRPRTQNMLSMSSLQWLTAHRTRLSSWHVHLTNFVKKERTYISKTPMKQRKYKMNRVLQLKPRKKIKSYMKKITRWPVYLCKTTRILKKVHKIVSSTQITLTILRKPFLIYWKEWIRS